MQAMDISQLLSTLNEWEEIAFGNERDFLQVFCNNAWTLTEVSWSSENMKFVYILDSGEHIADRIQINKWFEFVGTIKGEIE